MLTNLRSNSTQPLDNLTGPVRYGLTNDYMFRAVFQNSEEALRHLLSALLDIHPASPQPQPPDQSGDADRPSEALGQPFSVLSRTAILQHSPRGGLFQHYARPSHRDPHGVSVSRVQKIL